MEVIVLVLIGYFIYKVFKKPIKSNDLSFDLPPPSRITANVQIEKKAIQTLEAAYNLHNTKNLTIAQNCLKILHPNLVWLNGYYQKFEDMYERSIKNAIEMYRERYYDRKLNDEIKAYIEVPNFYLGGVSSWTEHCLDVLLEVLESFALSESSRIDKLKTEKAIDSNNKKVLKQIDDFVKEVSAEYKLNETALKKIEYCKSFF